MKKMQRNAFAPNVLLFVQMSAQKEKGKHCIVLEEKPNAVFQTKDAYVGIVHYGRSTVFQRVISVLTEKPSKYNVCKV